MRKKRNKEVLAPLEWKKWKNIPSTMEKLEYLLIQAHQQHEKYNMQFLDSVAQEFQKMNQRRKLAHTYNEWKLHFVKWILSKSEHDYIFFFYNILK